MKHEDVVQKLVDAIAHHKAGRTAEAEPLYREVLEYNPKTPTALQNLGLILNAAGKHDEAIELLKQSLEIETKVPLFYRNYGSILRGLERSQEAVDAVRKAVMLAPDEGLGWADLGVSLDRAGYLVEALAVYERAIRLLGPLAAPTKLTEPSPSDGTPTMELARAHYNLGSAFARLHKVDAAMSEYEQSIRIVASFGEPHRNRAAILFQRGQMAEAWREYEWRWKCADYPGKYPNFRQHTWNGADPAGKTIMLWWEQGFGDTIQFCRYAKVLNARGARVVLICQKEMKRLLQTLDGVAELAASGERKIEFDAHASLMSLPGIMQTSLETIPSGKAYLRADPKDAAEWEKRLSADGPGMRVGLVWAGAAAHKQDNLRSIPITTLAPLLALPGIKFYSLQLGDAAAQLKIPPGDKIIDHAAHIHDFADTAAFIDRLDLLITVDTAAAHLGGAIGKETWMLIAFEPDFRWMADRDNPSRWYPSMRLFRQAAVEEWKPVVEAVVKELKKKREGNAER